MFLGFTVPIKHLRIIVMYKKKLNMVLVGFVRPLKKW
jgi:hypothetical protein